MEPVFSRFVPNPYDFLSSTEMFLDVLNLKNAATLLTYQNNRAAVHRRDMANKACI